MDLGSTSTVLCDGRTWVSTPTEHCDGWTWIHRQRCILGLWQRQRSLFRLGSAASEPILCEYVSDIAPLWRLIYLDVLNFELNSLTFPDFLMTHHFNFFTILPRKMCSPHTKTALHSFSHINAVCPSLLLIHREKDGSFWESLVMSDLSQEFLSFLWWIL